MSPTAFRWLIGALGAALVALVVAVAVIDTDGEEVTLPDPLRSIFPLPGDVVIHQTGVEVELPIGYEITLSVDGLRIPDDEIIAVPEIGAFRWTPGPGQVIERWTPGDRTIHITWDRVAGGRPDPGEFTWTFRVV